MIITFLNGLTELTELNLMSHAVKSIPGKTWKEDDVKLRAITNIKKTGDINDYVQIFEQSTALFVRGTMDSSYQLGTLYEDVTYVGLDDTQFPLFTFKSHYKFTGLNDYARFWVNGRLPLIGAKSFEVVQTAMNMNAEF